MAVVDNERPPYVAFERRPMEDRNASISAGHYVAKDVDFAIVTRPGSRDTHEVEAKPWLASMAQKAKEGTVPHEWVDRFHAIYKRWLEGETLPDNGTPIKTWPVLSPAARETILQIGYRTVEDLAAAPDNEVIRVGMGGISFKQKAQAWLDAANSAGKASEQIAALTQQVSDLTALTEKLIERNKTLEALLPQVERPVVEKAF